MREKGERTGLLCHLYLKARAKSIVEHPVMLSDAQFDHIGFLFDFHIFTILTTLMDFQAAEIYYYEYFS